MAGSFHPSHIEILGTDLLGCCFHSYPVNSQREEEGQTVCLSGCDSMGIIH